MTTWGIRAPDPARLWHYLGIEILEVSATSIPGLAFSSLEILARTSQPQRSATVFTRHQPVRLSVKGLCVRITLRQNGSGNIGTALIYAQFCYVDYSFDGSLASKWSPPLD